MSINVGDVVQIHSYKHNHKVHRIWDKIRILYMDDSILVGGNEKTRVIEANGRFWVTREPSICYFFKDYWFNIIGMFKSDGLHYYCNLSSPYVWDDEAIKYIDYDLDVRVLPDMTYTILDKDEYKMHSKKMDYSDRLDAVIQDQLAILLDMIKNKKGPFNHEVMEKYYEQFKAYNN